MSSSRAQDTQSLEIMAPGDRLEVRCTDPLSVIDIPHLVGAIGDRLEIIERGERETVFRIEKSAPTQRAQAADLLIMLDLQRAGGSSTGGPPTLLLRNGELRFVTGADRRLILNLLGAAEMGSSGSTPGGQVL